MKNNNIEPAKKKREELMKLIRDIMKIYILIYGNLEIMLMKRRLLKMKLRTPFVKEDML